MSHILKKLFIICIYVKLDISALYWCLITETFVTVDKTVTILVYACAD